MANFIFLQWYCTISKTYDTLKIDIRHTAILTFSKNDAWIIFVQITFQAENGCKQEYFPSKIKQESREKKLGTLNKHQGVLRKKKS